MTLIILGLVVVILTWIAYLATIAPEKVPPRPIAHAAFMGLGLLLALVGFARSLLLDRVFSPGAAVLAISAAALAALFFYLLTLARLPDGELKVAAGDSMIPFTARDHTGALVDSRTWRGRRILLKFFRGHW